MRQKIVLYPPTLDFTFLTQRPQQICSQFARNGYKVIYCNNTQSNSPVEEVEPNLFVYHNFQEVLNMIKHKQLKVDIFYYTWAKSAQYIDQIKAKVNMYDSVDSFSAWYEYEDFAVEKADIVLTSSSFLFDLRSKKHNNVHLVRNACPSDYIGKKAIKPKEFESLTSPIIIFSGAVGSWVNTRLLRKVAEKYTTVLVGKEFGKECPSNVINLGTKTHDELYSYYAYSDVCLLPFDTKQEVTQAACAIKMFEHMAAGKITVATKWSETELYPGSVLAAESEEEFLTYVNRAVEISNNSFYINRSLQYARENTWEKRFEIIHNVLNEQYLVKGM